MCCTRFMCGLVKKKSLSGVEIPESTSMARRTLPILKQGLLHPDPSPNSPDPVTALLEPSPSSPATESDLSVMEAMHAPIFFERYDVHGDMKSVPSEVIESMRKNKICLKGRLKTPIGGGVSSLNVQLRKELDRYASPVNCFNLPGLPTSHEDVDIVVVRENTEGEYSGLEHEVLESLKVMTKFCSERIARYAFEYAYLNNRKKVTAVHKANIMKLADGLFLESCREVTSKYPGGRSQASILVTPNLYGNLVANTAAGIAGGTGVMPGDVSVTSGNVGADHAVFEQGALAGNVGNEKILEQNKANPVALLLSSAMMLRHLQFPSFTDRLETSVKRVISEGRYRTKDLGGDSTRQEVVDAIIANLD
ncbi:unnamed protein product [Camellia sinensis]